jgi:hypothetical protein
MPTIFPQFEHAVFDPEMTRLMGERACLAQNSVLLPRVVREAMANRCDPDQLSTAALKGTGL